MIDIHEYADANMIVGSVPLIIKPFGVHGLTTETGMGFNKVYDSNLPYPESEEVEVCEDKYVMLSAFPVLSNTDDTTDATFEFTAM